MVEEKTKRILFRLLKSPVVIAAIICALFIYLNSAFPILPITQLKLSENKLHSLLNEKEIVLLSGRFSSNPVKNNSFYKTTFIPEFAISSKNICSACSRHSKINIYIPEGIVELWYPGKLYSENSFYDKANMSEPVEEGIKAEITGFFGNNKCFYVKKINIYSADTIISGADTKQSFYLRRDQKSRVSFLERFSQIKYKIITLRARGRLYFKRLLYGWGEGGALLLALLTGAREYTNQNLAEAFKDAGISHIVALSGMHLSLFSAIAFFIGKKFKSRKIDFLLRLMFITGFVWFAGFTPSLFRAFLCSLFALFASLSKSEKPDSIKILCLTFLIHASVRPDDLFSQAFIYSYGALTGILLFSNIIRPSLCKKMPYAISSNLSSSIGAQALTAPYSFAVYKVFIPACVFSTLVISPLVSIFIYTGFIFIILSFLLPFLSPLFGGIIQILYSLIYMLVLFFAKIPAFHF
ncbi:MAG: ComEC/Rec2 family competence protein [Treponema sp.]|nr:ComEC/Rec2 family competence protein [Treponema sp.]